MNLWLVIPGFTAVTIGGTSFWIFLNTRNKWAEKIAMALLPIGAIVALIGALTS